MINLILPLLSFFMGRTKNFFREPGIALTQQLVMHIRSLSLLVVCSIGSLVLFCVGVSLLIHRLATEFDTGEEFSFSVGMGLYLGMVIVSTVALTLSLKKKTWLEAVGSQPKNQQTSKGGALENAVALLVMDFIEERQKRRQKTKAEDAPPL